MKDKLSAFWSGFKDKWSSLAKNLRIFIITAVSVVIVAAIVLAIVLNQKGYTAIYTGLDSEESSQVVSAINELGITDVKMGYGRQYLCTERPGGQCKNAAEHTRIPQVNVQL